MTIESANEFVKRMHEDVQFQADVATACLEIEKEVQNRFLGETKDMGFDFTLEELNQAQFAYAEKMNVLARMGLDSMFSIINPRESIFARFGSHESTLGILNSPFLLT